LLIWLLSLLGIIRGLSVLAIRWVSAIWRRIASL
jgi:hypothetical protein